VATVVFPSTIRVGAVSYGVQYDVQITTSRNGKVFTYGLPGSRWLATISFEPELETMQRPAIEALIVSLEGGINRLQMGHFGRPRPNGTLSSATTLASAVPAGGKSMILANSNGTLKRGDIVGLPGQLFMVTADAAPSAGNMTIAVAPAARAVFNSGTTVTWNNPQTLWIPRDSTAGPFPYAQGRVRPGFSLELVEAP
jgi:hypothetical protein